MEGPASTVWKESSWNRGVVEEKSVVCLNFGLRLPKARSFPSSFCLIFSEPLGVRPKKWPVYIPCTACLPACRPSPSLCTHAFMLARVQIGTHNIHIYIYT